ncbi:MAG: acyl-CoA dehydrogenase family protein, partial [Albimonas sp.]|uniref:acyl-CoA dehydrogenase family protein n=1 Tax=Albimonas sp. TaxID=1872425 RepID=UPI0040565872
MFARTLFNAEHEMFRDAAARFVAEHVVPHHDAWEKAGVVSREMWLRAGEQGLLCVTVPEAYGGPGADFLYAAIVLEEFVKKNASGPGLSVHSDIVAPYLVAYASEELKQAWLPKMCRGEAIGAIGMTEPGVGSDLQSMRTRAVRDGDDWVVSGQKTFISNGQCCDFVIVAAKTDPDARGKGVSLILVETDRAGFMRGRNLEKVGYKAQDTSELFFEDVRVPAANLVGVEGRGF